LTALSDDSAQGLAKSRELEISLIELAVPPFGCLEWFC
jgi:hypothetical protein